jgi:hypothetical protein
MPRQLYHLVRLGALNVPSTDPADTDLATSHMEVVRGEGFAIVACAGPHVRRARDFIPQLLQTLHE